MPKGVLWLIAAVNLIFGPANLIMYYMSSEPDVFSLWIGAAATFMGLLLVLILKIADANDL